MASNNTNVPLLLQVTAYSATTTTPNTKGDMQLEFHVQLITPQSYGARKIYDLSNIRPGMWITGSQSGFAWKIVSMSTTPGVAPPYDGTDEDGFNTITLIVEDLDNYNYLVGASASYSPNADTNGSYNYLIFETNSNNVPVFQGLYNKYYDSSLLALLPDIVGRFANTSPNTQYVDVYQASGSSLLIGDLLWLNDVTGNYEKALATNVTKAIGVVSGIQDANSFSFKVFGTYYNDIGSFFSENATPTQLSLLAATADGVSNQIETTDPNTGNVYTTLKPGTVLYINTASTGPTDQYIVEAPTDVAIPMWVYLGLDTTTWRDTGILYPFASSGSGLSVGGTGKTFVVKAPISIGSNFNFSTAAGGAVVTMNTDFGSAYTPINNGAGTADTTSFSVTLASTYNMSNIPMIFGTIAFWNGSQMNYNQLRFGNTNTTASVQAVITPTTANMSNTTGATAYGAPLTLTITGISKTSAFNGATNISSTSPTNYALQLYLQISN